MKKALHINFERIKVLLFFCAIFLLIFALGVKENIIDFDLWARLINGQHVVQTFKPMFVDTFSFSETHTWFDPEWLSSAFLYLIQLHFGIVGLTFLKCFLIFLLFCSLIYVLKSRNTPFNVYNLFYFTYLILLSKQVNFLGYSTRCQFISFIILVFWLYFLEKIRNGQDKYIYLLPFIMLFWLNSHGACIAGCGIVVLYLVGEILNRKPVKKYIILLLLLFLVFAINPWGIDYYKFMYNSAFVDRHYISEWASLFKFIPLQFNLHFWGSLVAIFAYIFQIIKQKQNLITLDKTKLILITTVLYLSCAHLKHVGLAIVVFTFFLYDDICSTFKTLFSKVNKKLFVTFNFFLYLIVFSYSLLVLELYSVSTSWEKNLFKKYPIYPLEFLKDNGYKGKLLTSFEYGSFIAYKYGENFKIYMDGRQEQVYYYKNSKDLIDFYNNENIEDKVEIIDKYEPDIVILDDRLFSNMKMVNNSKYFLLYDDKKYFVYVLNKYKNKKHKYFKINRKEYLNNLFNTNLDFAKDISK